MEEKDELIMCATLIMQGICAGDWKFDVKEKTWDEMAVSRSFDLAQAMLKERDERLNLS
jgi:hypothetical protein